ncbi:MAG: ISL3 family transposase [Kofleriaceae bacterium]
MNERQFYTQIFGIQSPWTVSDVALDVKRAEVVVRVDADPEASLGCPECGNASPRYDKRTRRWRHLDTCQFMTIIESDVPRVTCAEHGVLQVRVPWAEPNSGFTALFECLVIHWLQHASITAVKQLCRLGWGQVDTIMTRAVARGLARRKPEAPERVGVDETSFQRRHEYVTAVVDLDRPRVLHVADDRKEQSLSGYFDKLSPAQRAAIKVVAMDMWRPYINVVRRELPDGDAKIAFDKFHVASHLGDAVDRVRRLEHRELRAEGDDTLKGSKYLWLMNPSNMTDPVHVATFEALRALSLKTARAWAFKEAAMCLWHYVSPGHARNTWRRWIAWARRSKLEPIKRVAAMVRDHLRGIVTAIVTRTTNAASESINAKIQWIKRTACGFRNRERFRNAIYFHLGGLDMVPASCRVTHTNQ